MNVAAGILTVRGGMTSHAAVVARGMGKPAVCGCEKLKIDEKNKTLTTEANIIINEGEYLSIDGSAGNVYIGHLETSSTATNENFDTFMTWVDEIRDMEVRANADLPRDAEIALKFGAEGIGLCRTEHMFLKNLEYFLLEK